MREKYSTVCEALDKLADEEPGNKMVLENVTAIFDSIDQHFTRSLAEKRQKRNQEQMGSLILSEDEEQKQPLMANHAAFVPPSLEMEMAPPESQLQCVKCLK